MKKLIILCAIVLTTMSLITLAAGCQQQLQPPPSTSEGQTPQDGKEMTTTGDIQMTVTINSLEKGEEATLTISEEGKNASEELFFIRQVTSDGNETITVEIATNLKDGYYQLLLEAPHKYFREPKGYFFMVSQSKIVNPTGRIVIFNLLPQPEGLVAEVYRSLSAPLKQPPPPPPPIRSRVVPDESHYLPGEPVEVKFLFTNVSSEPITLTYPPEIRVTPHYNNEPVLFSQNVTEQKLEIIPEDTLTIEFTWDQRDKEGNQVPPGWYNIVFEHLEIKYAPRAMVLIQYPQGAMEKTIEVNESRTTADITVTLERIELTFSGMMVYAFVTLPGYPPTLQSSPFIGSFTEYSIDGGGANLLSYSGMKYLGNGTRFIWGGTRPGMIDPISSDAHELIFRITSIKVSPAPDKPYEIVNGPWEFEIQLQ